MYQLTENSPLYQSGAATPSMMASGQRDGKVGDRETIGATCWMTVFCDIVQVGKVLYSRQNNMLEEFVMF